MPIQIIDGNGNPVFSPNITSGASGIASSDHPPLVDLSDVNKVGLNDNDVLVFDATTGKFKPIDIDVINDNDGGVF